MNTLFLLMAEFETAQIPLEACCEKYFDLSLQKARNAAAHHRLPVPAFKVRESQKSTWFIHAQDLADHIDHQRAKARREHAKIQRAGAPLRKAS